jgi:hypothetical protein
MHADRETTSDSDQAYRRSRRPRVVILDEGDAASVEVLELPESVDVGGSFCHLGTRWRVTGLRTSSLVFIAEPTEN